MTIQGTVVNGVVVLDAPQQLPEGTRVEVRVRDKEVTRQAWEALERIWQHSTMDSQGQRLTREQLHERR